MTNGESFAPVVFLMFKLLSHVLVCFRPIKAMKNNFLCSNSKTVKFRPSSPHKRPGQNFE